MGRPAREARARRSGVEPLDDPRAAVAPVAEAIVQPVVAVLPELPRVGREAKPSPRRGPRNVSPWRAPRHAASSSSRLASTSLCRDTTAPACAPGGRVAKYASDSSAGT